MQASNSQTELSALHISNKIFAQGYSLKAKYFSTSINLTWNWSFFKQSTG